MTTREPRRLETGDWVRVRGDDPSLRGVGKVVDGDFAAEDSALTACQLEVGARSLWISPADLARITPDEEARLCDVALARGLVPAERRARLDDALREFRAGRRAVIRTPGLVDLLWATSTLADPTHGSGAVTAFLAEEALAALVRVTGACGMDLGSTPDALDALRVQREIVAAGVASEQVTRALDPRLLPDEVLKLAFELLSRDTLFALATRFGLASIASELRIDLVREALQALPPDWTLRQVIATLPTTELMPLALRLGLHEDGLWDPASVRARIANVAGLPPDPS